MKINEQKLIQDTMFTGLVLVCLAIILGIIAFIGVQQ
jgi:hypothetical protein